VLHQDLNQQFLFLRQIPYQERLINDLKRQNSVLSVTAQKTAELEKENESLRAVVKSPQIAQHQLLPVRLIGLNRFAFINQGSQSGLKVGQPLVVNDVFLGLISDVASNTAKATLLNDPNLKLDVITSQGTSGTVKFSQNQFEITQILQKDPLFVDDRIFTKTSEMIPANLLLGTVTKIAENQSSVYQTATYQPSINIFEVTNAFVILD
jgi:rod shape-determining protein MreC